MTSLKNLAEDKRVFCPMKTPMDVLLKTVPLLSDARLRETCPCLAEVVQHLEYIDKCRKARNQVYEPWAVLGVSDAEGYVRLVAQGNVDALGLYERIKGALKV